jgi:hypothetical protein
MMMKTVGDFRRTLEGCGSGEAGSVCLFSSYFQGTALPYFVRHYLAMLKPHFDRIVFLANDDREIDAESMAWLSGATDAVMLVRNEGYDFGMWQKAVREMGGLSAFSRVALVNDSCICFAPLDDLFRWLDAAGAPAAGMVLSNERFPHLQSYFLVLSDAAIPVVEHHLLSVGVVGAGYADVVRLGELGLSRALQDAGFRLEARYLPPPELLLNATLTCCYKFIDEGMPIIKRRSLRYPLGFVVRHAIKEGVGFHPLHYIRKIRALYPERAEEIDELFAGQFEASLAGSAKLHWRVARYWMVDRLARLRGRVFPARR